MSALQAIKTRLKDYEDPKQTDELDLSQIEIGTITDDIRKQLDKYKNVTTLLLQGCGLTSLDNLPSFKLNIIEVSENKLKDQAIAILASQTSLHQIVCANNQIQSLDALKPLTKLKNLTELDLSGNPVASKENYRSWLFENIESLDVLDNRDKEGNVVEEEEEFQEGGSEDEEDWDQDDDEEEEYEESESESEKPKKKKK